jgi:hypothetical protein
MLTEKSLDPERTTYRGSFRILDPVIIPFK